MADKEQAGPVVDFTGFTLDAIRKTIAVHEKTRRKLTRVIEQDLYWIDGKAFLNYDDLESAVGLVSWAATTSPLGRTMMFALIGALNEGRAQSCPVVAIPDEAVDELKLWASTEQRLPMGSFKVAGVKAECYSDASKDYIAAKANGMAFCGPVPIEYIDHAIAVKEALALLELVKLLKKNQIAYLNVDNMVLHGAFEKRRSKNEKLNRILRSIFELIRDKKLVVVTRWISTDQMAEATGADRLSRRDLSETFDPFSLSEAGVNLIREQYGKIHVDVFSGPLNNVFDTMYCSAISVQDDQKSLKIDGLTFLTTKKLEGRIWIFPPLDLVLPCLSILKNIKWPTDDRLQVLLVIPQETMQKAILLVSTIFFLFEPNY